MEEFNSQQEMPESKGKKKSNNRLIILLLLLMFPTGIFLGTWIAPYLSGTNSESVLIEEKELDIDEIKTQSDSLYRALQAELDFYKNQTDSLYPEINQREEELEKQYTRLQGLIQQAQKDKSSTADVKKKMDELRGELTSMRAFVDSQTLNLAEMRRENAKLIAEKKELGQKYEEEKHIKEKLEKEFKHLKVENEELASKVDKASVLQVINVKAIGARLSSKGVDKEIDIAKKVEFMKVCFDVVRNEVTRQGVNKFYVTITDPTGWPIIAESRGSGKIANVETGGEEFFTTMKSFNYNPDFKELCITWSQDPKKPFEKGVYQVELFNQGYKVGKTTVTLK